MLEVASLLVVLVMSLIITRVATVALTLTGMRQEAARFQARSALTGSGFTTTESERVVNHPVRRRVIMTLMLVGNTGLVLVASLMVVLLAGGQESGLAARWQPMALLLAGLVALYAAARSAWLERMMGRWIERILARHTDLARRDYASLLRLGGDYRVVEMHVEEGDWLAGRSLATLDLSREGVLALGVTRADGSYLGAPRGDTTLAPGDIVMLYGREAVLTDLDERRAGVGGQLRHAEAIARQREAERAERTGDADEAEGPHDADAPPGPSDDPSPGPSARSRNPS
jgi:hypothetical protein